MVDDKKPDIFKIIFFYIKFKDYPTIKLVTF